jgi:methyl-accepting chemotaxis protein
MLNRLKVSTKLVGVISLVVLAASATLGWLVLRDAEQALYAQTTAQLEAERESRSRLVLAFFRRLRDQARISSQQLVTQVALRDRRDPPLTSPDTDQRRVIFHPYARGLVETFAYPDILLAGTDGIVLYAFAGNIAPGANLRTEALGATGAGQAFAQVAAAAADSVVFIDYQPFAPAGGAAAGFIAAPVFDTDSHQRLGALIFQVSPDEISGIMTEAAGFGASGETYLIGPDLLVRTNSRFDRESVILQRAIRTDGGRRGLDGETGTIEQIDYRDVPVLAAFKPIDILGVRWAIVAKMDIDEALGPARSFRSRLLQLIAVVGLVVGFVLWEALRRIVLAPVAALAAGAKRVAASNYAQPVGLPGGDELAQLGQSFDTMMVSVGAQVEALTRARAAEQLSQRLLEAAPDGVVVVNASGRIAVLNEAAERLFGYARSELIGQPIEALVPDAARAHHVGRRDGYLAQPATRGMGIGLELEGRRKDGTLVPVEISLSPLEGPDGRLGRGPARRHGPDQLDLRIATRLPAPGIARDRRQVDRPARGARGLG